MGVCNFGRNLASVALKMFSHLIYLKMKFYTLRIFNAICRDNTTINFVTVQHKKAHSRGHGLVILERTSTFL